MGLSATELARYSRHLLLDEVGASGQERLRAARVLIVGAGGLGSPVALYLAASGIGTLGIIDGDRVELSNLQRQVLFATSDVGRCKALVACERLTALNPEVSLQAHALELNATNIRDIFGAYDLVVDGSDRVATRYLVNDACVIFGKALVSAAVHRFEGQIMTYVPGAGPCYRCLFPQATAEPIQSCAEAGVLGVLPGVLGTLQATEAIKVILGRGQPLLGRLLCYDALELSFREFPFARRLHCAVCGQHPSIAAPHDLTPACEAAPAGLRRLAPGELADLLSAAASRATIITVVDVREPHEFEAGHIAHSVSIPLGELELRIEALAGDALTVFVCRSGARSARAYALAARRGLANGAHLEGGLIAWANTVDPSLRVV